MNDTLNLSVGVEKYSYSIKKETEKDDCLNHCRTCCLNNWTMNIESNVQGNLQILSENHLTCGSWVAKSSSVQRWL